MALRKRGIPLKTQVLQYVHRTCPCSLAAVQRVFLKTGQRTIEVTLRTLVREGELEIAEDTDGVTLYLPLEHPVRTDE